MERPGASSWLLASSVSGEELHSASFSQCRERATLALESSQGRGCVVIPGNVILILSHKSACQEPKQPEHSGAAVPACRAHTAHTWSLVTRRRHHLQACLTTARVLFFVIHFRAVLDEFFKSKDSQMPIQTPVQFWNIT